jgi:oligosaccharide repeat unit polymerase
MPWQGAVLAALALFIGASAVIINRDLLSPAKLYLGILLLTFGDVMFKPQRVEIYLIFLCLMFVTLFGIVWERKVAGRNTEQAPPGYTVRKQGVRLLWAASIVSIAAQMYMIWQMGGFGSYLVTIGIRAVDWAGTGPVRSVALLLPVTNALYAVALLAKEKRGSGDRWLFALHCVLTLAITLLSGSRNTMIGWLIALLAVSNYAYRRLTIPRAFGVLAVMLSLIVVVGAARGAYRWTSSGFEVQASTLRWTHGSVLYYGLYPVQQVVDREPTRLYWGGTFLTAFTNVVPRQLWPGKPATGGVLFTRDYLFDRWQGRSHFSTGIFAEFAINFGQRLMPLGLLVLAVGLHTAALVQKRAQHTSPAVAGYWAAMYAFILPMTVGLLYLEFTTAWVLVLTRAVPLAVLYRVAFTRAA